MRQLYQANPMDAATLSAEFQISIPKAVREAHKCGPGQEFAFISKDSGVLLVPVPESDQLPGFARGAKPKNYRDREIDTEYRGYRCAASFGAAFSASAFASLLWRRTLSGIAARNATLSTASSSIG
jgi:bifunctional DNA-binding transcriptional regulator/antitoxin component of YhaV-PrlF toxin-antitoxin module